VVCSGVPQALAPKEHCEQLDCVPQAVRPRNAVAYRVVPEVRKNLRNDPEQFAGSEPAQSRRRFVYAPVQIIRIQVSSDISLWCGSFFSSLFILQKTLRLPRACSSVG
jgi:sensor c-di-GMP phosphodiesterase-like protein